MQCIAWGLATPAVLPGQFKLWNTFPVTLYFLISIPPRLQLYIMFHSRVQSGILSKGTFSHAEWSRHMVNLQGMERGGHLWASEWKCLLDCYLTVRSLTPNKKGATPGTTAIPAVFEKDIGRRCLRKFWCWEFQCGAVAPPSAWNKRCVTAEEHSWTFFCFSTLVQTCLLPEFFDSSGLVTGIFPRITPNLFRLLWKK